MKLGLETLCLITDARKSDTVLALLSNDFLPETPKEMPALFGCYRSSDKKIHVSVTEIKEEAQAEVYQEKMRNSPHFVTKPATLIAIDTYVMEALGLPVTDDRDKTNEYAQALRKIESFLQGRGNKTHVYRDQTYVKRSGEYAYRLFETDA